MLRETVDDDPRFEVNDLELRREGPSFTVDTLGEIAQREPQAHLVLMLGADQWADFSRWRSPARSCGLPSSQ
jgi:nicotinate-nucleotide adenylyltransferase